MKNAKTYSTPFILAIGLSLSNVFAEPNPTPASTIRAQQHFQATSNEEDALVTATPQHFDAAELRKLSPHIDKTGAQSKAEGVTIQLPSNPLTDILEVYEALTKTKILIGTDVPKTANFSIIATDPIPKDDAISLIEAILLMNGYAFVHNDEGAKVIEFSVTKPGNPRSEGLPVYAYPAPPPKHPKIITYFLPFQYIDARIAQLAFREHVALNKPYGSIAAVPSAKALLITENVDVIEKLIMVKNLIDKPSSMMVSEFVELESADASRVAKTLNNMIKEAVSKKPSGTLPAGSSLHLTMPMEQGGATAFNIGTDFIPLVPDTRTNRILVMASSENFSYIKSLIQYFDNAPTKNKPEQRHLQYVTASEVIPLLSEALALTEDDSKNQATAAQAGLSPTKNAQITASASSTASDVSGLDAPSEQLGASAVTIGRLRIIGDDRSNTIVMIGPPESISTANEIITLLDQAPRQVFLSVVIGSMTVTEGQQLGIDILQTFQGSASNGIANSSQNSGGFSGSSKTNPTSLTSLSSFAEESGLTSYGVLGGALNFYIKALETTSRFHLISRPTIYTTNNKEAYIISGSQIPFPQQILSDSSANSDVSTTLNSSIEYKDVNLKLGIRPLINASDEVTLTIRQTNDSVGDSQGTIQDIKIVSINTQELSTTVTVANNDIVVLGGLISEQDTDAVSGVPILKDLPLIGNLFKNTNKTITRTELLVMIQPKVISGHREARMNTYEERERLGFDKELQSIVDPDCDKTPIKRNRKPFRFRRKCDDGVR